MRSPFPGMDPYLEQSWGDVHTSLTTYARDQLRTQLPPDLLVRVEEYLTVESEPRKRRYKPDVRVVETLSSRRKPAPVRHTVTLTDSVTIELQSEPATCRRIRVLDASAKYRLVTAIEFLSEANKHGKGADQFQAKQRDFLEGGASLVEIDLLRTGNHVLSVPQYLFPNDCREPYRVCVLRSWDREHAELYRVSFRKRLPKIAIPLREADPPAALDLQALINLSYRNGNYADDIDYSKAALPVLDGEDGRWADKLLRAAGLRK